jgi:hypothetical protein
VTEAPQTPKAFDLVAKAGPWPFTTYRSYRTSDGASATWQSRIHRKNLRPAWEGHSAWAAIFRLRTLWRPRELNWWIAVVFAIGSSLFLLGSVFSLAPTLARGWSLDSTTVNALFFLGSIPFTSAAYLQLFQAANAAEFMPDGARPRTKTLAFGWQPHDIGWLSTALQFSGTLLFNVNTFDAMVPGFDWLQQDLAIWAPDFVGSILFLLSGYLAFVETCHAHFAWRPGSLSWWVTLSNLIGCVAFMISAVYAFVTATPTDFDTTRLSLLFTLIGAAGFLLGSLLMLPESATPPETAS